MKRISIVRKLGSFFSVRKFAAILILLMVNTVLAIAYPFIYKLFIDEVLFRKDIKFLIIVLVLMAIWMICNGIGRYTLCKVRTDFLVRLLYEIKKRLIDNIMDRSLDYYLKNPVNEMKHVVEDDCNEVENFFITDIFDFILSCLNVCVLTIVMLVISPPLLAGCTVLFVISYFETKLIKGKVIQNAVDLRNALSEEDHVRSDEIKNIKDIKCLNYTDEIIASFHERSKKMIDLITKEKIFFYINKYLGALNHDLISRFFVYTLGGFLVINGRLSISSFLVFLGFYESFVRYMRVSMESNFNLNNKINKLENILEYLALDVPVENEGEGASKIDCVELSNVNFRYAGSRDDRYVIHRLSNEFYKGRTYLIQGRSGAGKSTLMKLLYKEQEHYTGSIRISGKELSDYEDAYYSRIAVASYDSRLFHTTIRDNLLVADSAATDEMLYEACKKAEFEKDLQKIPGGLDAAVGENGSALSGGQRERLIVSRLFLKHADLYILDEALDEISVADEVKILDELRRQNRESIIMIISHRLTEYNQAEYVQI